LTVALYPGSFDPVTRGHVDIVERAASLFEEVIVAVYDAPPKHLLFSTEERVDLMKRSVGHLSNVRVVSYAGLTVDFAESVKAKVLVRGLRVSSDFEREFEMALMNKKLAPCLELVCFMTNQEYQFVSSSLIKEVCKLGGHIDDLVPEHVAGAMREKLCD